MLKIITLIFLSIATTVCIAITPKDPKYCKILEQIKPNMQIGEVFVLMGPPHSFGQPPNLNMQTVNSSKAVIQPQNTVSEDTPATRSRIQNAIAADPILGAFINAPPDSTNVLIWNFENNTLNVAVQVKGSMVTDVKTNFTCQ